MIYKTKPEDFNSKLDIVSCFLEHNGKILLLQRQDGTPQENTWGVPAGKVDEEEDIFGAIVREVSEETGYKASPKEFNYFDKVYVRYPEFDFVYHMFHIILNQKPNIKINSKEHKDSTWASPQEALNLLLIPDEDACIKLFYKLDKS